MKKPFLLKSLALLLAVAFAFQACEKDKTYELKSLLANTTDLNGATSATGVDPKANLVASFSEAINVSTATAANIKLTRDYDKADVPVTITVADKTVTIDPTEDLGSGTLYKLSISSTVAYADGKSNVAAIERTFTTAGTFAPAGAVAHWNFEGNGTDKVGNRTPTNTTAITYSASRNTAAGQAATFDGDASIMEYANGDQLMNAQNFTLSFWVKTNSAGHVDAGGNPAGHFVMGLGAFKGFQFEIGGGYDACKLAAQYAFANGQTGAEDLWFNGDGKTKDNGGWQGWDFAKDLSASGGVAALLKDKWAHIVCLYNAADRRGIMYINGEKMKSFDFDLWPDGDAKRTVTGLKYGGVAPEVVNEFAFGFVQSRAGTLWDTEPWGGYDFPTANHFKGQLDDVRIFHKALTEQEIQLMYNSEK